MSDSGITGMRDEYERHLAAQNPVRKNVLCPKFSERLLDDRKLMMRVEFPSPSPESVCRNPELPSRAVRKEIHGRRRAVSRGLAETARELITLREPSKARSSTGAKSVLNPRARQNPPITEPCFRNRLRSAVAKTSAADECPRSGAEAVDSAALHVHAGEQGCGDAGLTIFEKSVSLLRGNDIPGKKNDPAGWICVNWEWGVGERLRCHQSQ